ncbi:MAG: Transcriptional regulator, HxlR family, partial [uncultured Rubrobacteraceae bacterium]
GHDGRRPLPLRARPRVRLEKGLRGGVREVGPAGDHGAQGGQEAPRGTEAGAWGDLPEDAHPDPEEPRAQRPRGAGGLPRGPAEGRVLADTPGGIAAAPARGHLPVVGASPGGGGGGAPGGRSDGVPMWRI